MEYNSSRVKIIIPEYGRNVQNLVQFMLKEKDKKVRSEIAFEVIDLMALMNPFQRNNPEYKHKLWDHLFIISDFKLDVDGPYEMPSKVDFEKPPKVMEYPQNRIKYKHYGLNIELMVKKAQEIKDPDKNKEYVKLIVSYMKMAYRNWHHEQISDENILADLAKMSDGKLTIDKKDIPITRAPQQHQKHQQHRKSTNFHKRNSNSNNHRRRKNNR